MDRSRVRRTRPRRVGIHRRTRRPAAVTRRLRTTVERQRHPRAADRGHPVGAPHTSGGATWRHVVSGDLLDIILIIAIVSFAWSGYRQGFVVGAFAFAGFIGGAVIAAEIAPSIASALVDGAARSVVAIVVVIVIASLGELAAATGGGLLRRRITWRPARLVDSGFGAGISVVSLLLVAWIIGFAVAQTQYRGLAKQV